MYVIKVWGRGRPGGRAGGCRRPCWISFLEKDFLFRPVPNQRPLNPKSDALSTELRRSLTEGRPVSQAGSTASRMRAQVEKGCPSPRDVCLRSRRLVAYEQVSGNHFGGREGCAAMLGVPGEVL